jgi:hypothetical protein
MHEPALVRSTVPHDEVKEEKEHREFKLERYRCVPADVVYPHMTPRK